MMKIHLFSLVFILTLVSCRNEEKAFTRAYNIPYATGIEIDGNAADWQNQGLIIPLVADVWGQMDSKNFSATVSLAWDESYFYILADVIDDTLHQENTGPIWRNDGMENCLIRFDSGFPFLLVLFLRDQYNWHK